MPLIRVAVVGLYFGTIPDPATPPTGQGVAGSKFRSAPQIEVGATTTVRKICRDLSFEVASGKFSAYSRFQITPSAAGFLRKIEVGIAQPIGPVAAGTYSITDSSAVEDPPGYKFAWQTYFFNENFDQTNTDGTTKSLDEDRNFNEGDLLLFRCLVIVGPNPVDVFAPGNIPALTS